MDVAYRKLFEGPVSDLQSRPYPYERHRSDGSEDNSILSAVMFTTDTRASFLMSRKVTGVAKSGKTWSRWDKLGKLSICVKENAAGIKSMNVYGTFKTGRKWSMFKNISFDSALIKTIILPEFIDEVNVEARRLALSYMPELIVPPLPEKGQAFGRTDVPFDYSIPAAYYYIPELIYPMIRTRIMPDTASYAVGKSFGARAFTEMEYAKKLFGKTNYRKDLVKAVAETDNFHKIFFAHEFRNHVPIDWIVQFLQRAKDMKNFPELGKNHLSTLRKILPYLPMKNRRRLLTELTKAKKPVVAVQDAPVAQPVVPRRRIMPATYYVQDALTFASKIAPASFADMEFTGWKEFHDLLVEAESLQRNGNVKIPETALSKKIALMPEDGEISIILPEDTQELRFWGRKMSHCIGSYAQEAASGRHVFIGIIKDGEMIGNAQIDPSAKRCLQLLGKHNQHLDKSDVNRISSLFEQHKILPKTAFQTALGVR